MQNQKDLESRGQMDQLLWDPVEEKKQTEFDIMELLYHLVDKLPQILIVSVLCAALMFSWIYFFVTPTYQATTKLYVLSAGNSSISSQLLSEFQIGNYLTNDYRQVFRNKEVHDIVLSKLIDKLGEDAVNERYRAESGEWNYAKLDSMLSITNPSDTRVLVVTITSKDQREARQMAEAYADAAEEFIENRMGGTLPDERFEKVYSERVSKHTVQNTVLVFLAAFLAMVTIYSVAFVMDDRITSSDFIEKRVGIVTLGMMPLVDQESQETSSKGKKKFGRKER